LQAKRGHKGLTPKEEEEEEEENTQSRQQRRSTLKSQRPGIFPIKGHIIEDFSEQISGPRCARVLFTLLNRGLSLVTIERTFQNRSQDLTDKADTKAHDNEAQERHRRHVSEALCHIDDIIISFYFTPLYPHTHTHTHTHTHITTHTLPERIWNRAGPCKKKTTIPTPCPSDNSERQPTSESIIALQRCIVKRGSASELFR
jgi:hypothetical protein